MYIVYASRCKLCFFTRSLQTIWNRKENIGEKRHNSTVGGKVSVEKKKIANCKTGPNIPSLWQR